MLDRYSYVYYRIYIYMEDYALFFIWSEEVNSRGGNPLHGLKKGGKNDFVMPVCKSNGTNMQYMIISCTSMKM